MNVNILLFSDFETLDAFGPVEVLGRVEKCHLRYFSTNGGLVTSSQGVSIVTDSLENVDFSGILLVPGGQGTRHLINDNTFIKKLSVIALQSQYCLTVCTGSALLAKANLLNGRKATSNKRALEWVRSVNSNVQWISCARWVVDGKFYTSSGVSAGMDMALGFISDRFGIEKATEIAQSIEYIWNSNKDNDLFAK
ncbi:Isonitrile hydratase [Sporomusa silvacetica DSM 10669]|uniref:Isonitrile hydratase n=1 Tax=Sporomusa silvacetica DSM 10669 TaxID=1123289 RepID=A0ABZ3IIH7_9FIRM|nr:DJ-1/PfpI family protein [Sporomusa silvacetica]OZC16789.1 isonitrile hydratase [Sporomusa silvacetica DSM 10669]